eukprot:CAMPEP_0173467646 /NCGR_PEP_ID=MMETSP1357-20121228/75447_1 /TAXON_ID=77926 /ORGANISM="Hemiselmis rufescens, Strain PCC563" /LENGTH=52 /DNA_ID=CAMNT_0014435797 /DNA_START=124 /DNA_END=282 /DNA_ORIENTATION=+
MDRVGRGPGGFPLALDAAADVGDTPAPHEGGGLGLLDVGEALWCDLGNVWGD